MGSRILPCKGFTYKQGLKVALHAATLPLFVFYSQKPFQVWALLKTYRFGSWSQTFALQE
jgi:hypothetical protein